MKIFAACAVVACAVMPVSAWAQQAYFPPQMPPVPQADVPFVNQMNASTDATAPVVQPLETPEQSAHDVAAKAAIARVCGGNVNNFLDLLQASPYAAEGKCYFIPSLPVGQWLAANSVLVTDSQIDMPLNAIITSSAPLANQMTNAGIYVGGAPSQYQSVGAGELTASYFVEVEDN
jgi:hypothetical protein